MKDKVQKIREEVARIQAYTQSDVLKELLSFIDSLQEEPVSEDLEKEIEQYEESFRHKSTQMGYKETARHFAQWQKEQMMKDATEVTVHVDAGGYPYIPQMELYDYDKDISLAKEGDKYKVVLIKEE